MELAPASVWTVLSRKQFVLSVLFLTNLLYVGMLISRSPDTFQAGFNAIITQQEYEERKIPVNTVGGSPALEELQDIAVDLPLDTSTVRRFKCLGWRATRGCTPNGARMPQNDQDCRSTIPFGTSGYCEIEDEESHEIFRVMKRTCSRSKQGAIFQCADAPGFASFRVEAEYATDQVLAPGFALPNVNSTENYQQQGVVMVVYPKLVASAYATIRALRDVLNCQLPIEIWFRPDEMRQSPEGLNPLIGLGNLSFEEIHGQNAVWFNTKIYAIYHSKFDRVLFLDADNVPVRDPSYLFETSEFVETGAVFWPDYWHPDNTIFYINAESLVWQLLGTDFVDMFEQESGQVLIDRRRHAAALERFAWLKLGASFHMMETPPAVAGKMFGKSFCGMTMVQHDTTGEIMFLHRNQQNLTGKPRPDQVDEAQKPLTHTKQDDFPDPAMWMHLLSFRKTSARSKYVNQAH